YAPPVRCRRPQSPISSGFQADDYFRRWRRMQPGLQRRCCDTLADLRNRSCLRQTPRQPKNMPGQVEPGVPIECANALTSLSISSIGARRNTPQLLWLPLKVTRKLVKSGESLGAGLGSVRPKNEERSR